MEGKDRFPIPYSKEAGGELMRDAEHKNLDKNPQQGGDSGPELHETTEEREEEKGQKATQD